MLRLQWNWDVEEDHDCVRVQSTAVISWHYKEIQISAVGSVDVQVLQPEVSGGYGGVNGAAAGAAAGFTAASSASVDPSPRSDLDHSTVDTLGLFYFKTTQCCYQLYLATRLTRRLLTLPIDLRPNGIRSVLTCQEKRGQKFKYWLSPIKKKKKKVRSSNPFPRVATSLSLSLSLSGSIFFNFHLCY